jgi:hypothetical protein
MPDAQARLDADLDTHALYGDGERFLCRFGTIDRLPLTKIPYAAFDAHLIGVDPDYRIHVSDRLLEIHDGTFLELGLKGILGQVIQPRRRSEDRPDRDRLALRFEQFKNHDDVEEQSPERRSHDFHVVHFHKRPVCLCIHILPFGEHLFESSWRHADQQHAGLRPDILEGVRDPAGDEDNGPGGRAHDAIAEFEVKLPIHDVEELVLGLVDVGGRSALGRNGLAKQAERPSGLLACCQQFGDIRLSALRPRKMGCTVG